MNIYNSHLCLHVLYSLSSEALGPSLWHFVSLIYLQASADLLNAYMVFSQYYLPFGYLMLNVKEGKSASLVLALRASLRQ